ncbi:hypothetical protein RN347_15155 [Halomonas sp. PAMB 3264]|uniref:hypothetical protein n=1 Tax=Halomonas sp. PAMB 3264 TaxID=3075222 RepID=UPI00289F0F6D|nr:hypothetical protein [Halomonas sp. PAMB 3264]WNL41944.1 hypothetical protein RN347_15155 [Halomonas sp. PAMB 3264]
MRFISAPPENGAVQLSHAVTLAVHPRACEEWVTSGMPIERIVFVLTKTGGSAAELDKTRD